jgi:hypothetical protein
MILVHLRLRATSKPTIADITTQKKATISIGKEQEANEIHKRAHQSITQQTQIWAIMSTFHRLNR